MNRNRPFQGLALIELLIVIAIVGILMQLIIPAVEASREAARRSICANNLRQLAIASQLHESAHSFFPSGGWGWYWMGDADRGFGSDQPGGWIFNILPYVEQDSLRNMARQSNYDNGATHRRVAATPLSVLTCPSRRLSRAYPYIMGVEFIFLGAPQACARSDYAANLGSVASPPSSMGPTDYGIAKEWEEGNDPSTSWAASDMNGIVFQRSRTKGKQITDGLSKTLLLAEKYVPIDAYKSGSSGGDNEHMYMGYDCDILRSTHVNLAPQKDFRDDHMWRFGSAHPTTFNAAHCDGSVHVLSYDIAAEIFSKSGDRNGT